MSPSESDDDLRSRVRRSTLRLLRWTVAWLLTTAILAFGPTLLWDNALGATLLALALNLAAGLGFVRANARHLRDLDEMLQKVLLDAMGITLGIVLIVGIPYSLLDKVFAFEADIAHLYFVMGLTLIASVVVGMKRYR